MNRPQRTEFSRYVRSTLAGCLALVGWSVLADPPEYSPLPEAARPFDPPGSRRALLKPPSGPMVTEYQIGFDTRAVEIKQYIPVDTTLGLDSLNLWHTHYAELSDYLEDALAAGRRDAMRRELVGHVRFSDSVNTDVLHYELPVKIPDWAKRLGMSKPDITPSGTYTLQVKSASHWTSLEEQAGTANKFPDFSPEQIPNLNVTGKIGKFVSMTLTWNNDGFGASQSQDLHLRYAGEKPEDTEDDILQELEFGVIQLALPGTSLTGYSEAASGVLGVKTKLRFGDLDLTIIGGSEQGQTQKQKIGRSSKETISPLINDRDVDVGRDFFLNHDYRKYWPVYKDDPSNSLGYAPGDLQVFVGVTAAEMIAQTTWKPFYKGAAVVRDSLGGLGHSTSRDQMWRKLPATDWVWERGVLRLINPVGTASLAVAWGSGSKARGSVGTSAVDSLVLLSEDGYEDASLRALQLRNRYYRLGWVAAGDRPNMKVRVLDRNSTKGDPSLDSTGREWAKVFGLVGENGVPFHDNKGVFDWDHRAIIFPDLEPFRKFGRGEIYDTLKVSLPQLASSRFAIEITSKTSSDSIKIGSRDMASVSGSNCLDILEGSEVLTLNGSTRLIRGLDYDVQYQTGTITLLSVRAKEPSADIQVDFSCRPFFSLETRTVAGARLEYQMPWLGKQSVLGSTFLFRQESVTDPRPQLQREPNRAMLWGANLRLAGESEWLTDWTARIPFARVKGESKWRLELEGAQSWNNPNTEGYALVDDFESARQDNDLPVYAQSWYQASPPGGVPGDGPGNYEDSLDYRHQGDFVWSSNATEALRNIYPDHDDGSSAPQRQTILQLKLRSNDRSGAGHSWGGIMRPVPSSWRDNSSARYLEVVARANGGELSFDFGQVSEDLSLAGEPPDGTLESEDQGKGISQGDFGLDGMPDTAEQAKKWECYGKACDATVMAYIAHIDDPAGDDYKTDATNNDPTSAINGTEGNNDFVDGGKGTWFDAEDLDRNGFERVNAFDRYTIRLGGRTATASQQLVGGWRLYRIPLEEKTLRKGGGANWSVLRAMRVFYHGLNSRSGANFDKDVVQIARMSLVGNQWKSTGHMAKNDDTLVIDTSATGNWTSTTKVVVPDSSRLSASVVNNQDDNQVYSSWGVPTSTDVSSGAKLKEQSLRLVYKNLIRDYLSGGSGRSDTGVAIRIYDNPRDFTLYRNLGLLVYHQATHQPMEGSPGEAPVRIGIQFGSGLADMANNGYYEYSFNPVPADCLGDPNCVATSAERTQSMERSWQDNQIQVALDKLTSLKSHRQAAAISSDSLYREPLAVGMRPGPRSRDDSLAIKGDPSLSTVRWMRVWVRPNPKSGSSSRASGEVWINDLKLDEPYDGVGTALRGTAQVNFSDLLDLSASTDFQGGDFVAMGQKRPELSNQKTAAHASATAALSLEKFLPEAWQARLPFNYTVTAGVDRPWARPGSDQALTRDGLGDIASDWWNSDIRRDSADIARRNSKAYQTLAVSRTISSSWSRARDEGKGVVPFLVNTLFARPKLSWTYNEQGTLSPERRDSTLSHSISLTYDFTPPPAPRFKPFGSSTSKWVPSLLQGLTIQPWPTSITSTLGELEYLDGIHSVLPPDQDSLPRQRTLERRAGLNHVFATDWQLLDFLRLNANLRSTRAWDQPDEAKAFNPATGLADAWPLIFDWDTTQVRIPGALGGSTGQEFGLLRNEIGRQVGFVMDFSPRILPWVTTTGGFQANATANREAPSRRITGVGGIPDTTYMQYWRHDHSDNFRASLRLDIPAVFRTLQSLGPAFLNKPLGSASKLLDAWRWSGIGMEYTADNRISGVRQTLDYSSFGEGLDAMSLTMWQAGLGDGKAMRSPLDLLTGSRSKNGFGQYEPARLNNPAQYSDFAAMQAGQLGADRSTQVDTRSYRLSGSSEITVPKLLLRLEPSLAYQVSWDERWSQPWSVDTTVTWPQITVNASLPSLVARVPLLKRWFESVTANNTSTWERSQKIYPYREVPNSDNQTWKFAPLVGIQAKTKGNWSFDNRFNSSITRSKLLTKVASKRSNGACPEGLGLPAFYTDTTISINRCFVLAGSSQERSYDMGDEGTATYRLQTKRGIQILKWFVKLDNDLVVTFRGGWTHSWKRRDEVDPVTQVATPTQQMEDVTTVYGGSNATYNFTSKLVAQFDAKYQQTARTVPDDPQGETVNHDISILASLQYRF